METSDYCVEVATMKQRFYQELENKRSAAAKNTVALPDKRYQQLLDEVRNAKTAAKKVPRHYWLLNKYSIMEVQQKQLIQPLKEGSTAVMLYVADSELFDVLYKAHVSVGHGGRDRMIKELSSNYKNITRPDIELFLQLCVPCQQKHKGIKKGIVVKPIISPEFNSRCQVDLIDFQSHPDGNKKFILVYQDHLTKFVVLKALETKRAEEVAYNLIDIFTLIGAPSILQSDNGREFSNQIVLSIKNYWPRLQIVHGKPQHSQSQGSVERANQDIENMLTTWMQDQNSSRWSEGLRFVQLMKNRAYHSGIKMSPYEALFGCKVKVGLSTSNLPHEVLENIISEEDLQELAISTAETDKGILREEESGSSTHKRPPESTSNPTTEPERVLEEEENGSSTRMSFPESTSNQTSSVQQSTLTTPYAEPAYTTTGEVTTTFMCCVCSRATSGGHQCPDCARHIHVICGYGSSDEEGYGAQVMCPLCFNKKKVLCNREDAKANLEVQAEYMKKTSDKKFPPVNPGATVRISIPDCDKGRGDARNVLAIVIDVNDGFYQLGTIQGVLKQLYTRSQFTVCKQPLLALEEIPMDKKISLRSAATQQSTGTGQGFFKCSCKTKCQTKKCFCVKKNLLCNSKCHSSLDCCNK